MRSPPDRRGAAAADALLLAGTGLAVAVVLGLLGWLVADLVATAWPRLGWQLLTEAPRRAGRAGGILPILVGTLLMVAVCLMVALPLGLLAAAALAEARGRLAGTVRLALDVLAGAPSIVLGLVGLLVFADLLGLGPSIAAGGLTLAVMILPVVVRLGEAGLRGVDPAQRAAAAALGLSRWTTLVRICVPAALPMLAAAAALGLGRALAETAALVFTAGGSDRMPESLADPGRALAVHILDLAMNIAGGEASAAAAAVVLLAAIILIQAGVAWLLARVRPVPP